jgi:hypothetical protein
MLVAHAYNPSNSGGRDQEDCGSKPAQANSSGDPILKKLFIKKKGLLEWLKVWALSSSPSTELKKKELTIFYINSTIKTIFKMFTQSYAKKLKQFTTEISNTNTLCFLLPYISVVSC